MLSLYDFLGHKTVQNNNNEILKILRVSCKWCETKISAKIATENTNVTEVTQFLLQHFEHATDEDYNRCSPLHIAVCVRNNKEVIKLLLDRGQKINELKPKGEFSTPLHVACFKTNNTENIKFLIEHGADINIQHINGITPLFSAINSTNFETVELLIDLGADAITKSRNYYTPFYWAAKQANNNFEILVLLLKLGADPSCSPELEKLNVHVNIFETEHFQCNLITSTLMKLKALNLINEMQFSTWKTLNAFSNFETWKEACERGAKNMRSELICSDRNITFADILTKSLRTVAVLLNVDEIQKRVDEIDYDTKFPTYSEFLQDRIEKATDLAILFRMGYDSLEYALGDRQLPNLFLNETLKYLRKKDIKNLVEAVFNLE